MDAKVPVVFVGHLEDHVCGFRFRGQEIKGVERAFYQFQGWELSLDRREIAQLQQSGKNGKRTHAMS